MSKPVFENMFFIHVNVNVNVNYDDDDAFNSGDEIEAAEISVVDFSERNPFGEV